MNGEGVPTAHAPVEVPNGPYARGVKRVVDFVVATVALIFWLVPLSAAALLIKLDSAGPVFFAQDRVGRHGRIFQLLKLRTMAHGTKKPFAEVVGRAVDVTRVGWILRRLKIDELPQLLSIVRGDMSLVGPRPTVPKVVATFTPHERQRLLVRPGLTGLAQVNGNIHLTWPERCLWDLEYIRRMSFALDVQIIARTVLVLILGEERFRRVWPSGGSER